VNPRATAGERITNMRLNGKVIDADRAYRVAGWASVSDNEEAGKPVWEVLQDYLRAKQIVRVKSVNIPTVL
jgi:sulfur-oxidizing protein SoxB